MVSLQLPERAVQDVRDLMTDLREAVEALRSTIRATRYIAEEDHGRPITLLKRPDTPA